MEDGVGAVQWASRVSRVVIRRLYESDARGLLDEELVDEVFYGFLARCESIVTVTEAAFGRVWCPRCGGIVPRQSDDKDELLCCATCAWQTSWGAYHRTYQGKRLFGGNGIGIFQEYVRRAQTAGSAREKMLLVDWLVHQVHKKLMPDREEFHRPIAVNVIEGNVQQVTTFLNELAYGPGSTPEMHAEAARWRESVVPHLPRTFRPRTDR